MRRMERSQDNADADNGLIVVSVNVGGETTIAHAGRRFVTGIDKRPTAGRVPVSAAGLASDTICNLEHHGGIDQAVYVYGMNHYAWWVEELGRPLAPGLFGENLSIDNLPDDLRAGDRLLIGSALLEATGPRIPCGTFAARMEDAGFGMKFRRAEKPGFYFRVLESGDIGAGDRIELQPSDDDSNISMLELFRLYFDLSPDPEILRKALGSPITERLHKRFQQKLDAAID